MKTKMFTLPVLGILSLLLVMAFASAASFTALPSSLSFTKFDATETFTISNQGTSALDVSFSQQTLVDSDGNTAIVSFNPTSLNVASSDSETVTATLTAIDDDFSLGTTTKTYTVQETGNSSNSVNLTLSVIGSVCDVMDGGDLIVKIEDFSVINGFGDDEELLPLDEVEVEITVENKNDDYDIDDIEVSWGLYDTDRDTWYVDEEENDFNLKDGDEETLTVTFKLDEDIEDLDSGKYVFYVWANGVLDDDTSSGTDLCASDSQAVDIIIEKDFVILDNLNYPDAVSCGESFQLTGDVWNIGDKDQDDVVVKIYNTELGINTLITYSEIEAFESEDLDALIKIPEGASEGTYILRAEIFDEDNDIFENDFDDDEARFNIPLEVQGNCGVSSGDKDLSVSASLDSGGKAGEELVVKLTFVNTGEDSTFSLNVAGYTGWASSAVLSQSSFSLDSGDSREILVTFNVKEDASGENSFNVEVLSENQIVVQQPVKVSIEGKEGFSLNSLLSGENQTILWVFLGLNAILVIAIIIVAVRLIRK